MMQREAFVTDKMEKAKTALRCSSLWVMENPSLLNLGLLEHWGATTSAPTISLKSCLLSSPLPGAPLCCPPPRPETAELCGPETPGGPASSRSALG